MMVAINDGKSSEQKAQEALDASYEVFHEHVNRRMQELVSDGLGPFNHSNLSNTSINSATSETEPLSFQAMVRVMKPYMPYGGPTVFLVSISVCHLLIRDAKVYEVPNLSQPLIEQHTFAGIPIQAIRSMREWWKILYRGCRIRRKPNSKFRMAIVHDQNPEVDRMLKWLVENGVMEGWSKWDDPTLQEKGHGE